MAWGSDWCLFSSAVLLGCGHRECDGDEKLAGAGLAQLVHEVIRSEDRHLSSCYHDKVKVNRSKTTK